MYEVKQGKIELKLWSNQCVEVKQPAMLFDLLREEELAIMLNHGELSYVEECKAKLERVLELGDVTDRSEYVIISVSDNEPDAEKQCILMNYFMEATSSAFARALAKTSTKSREEAIQNVFQNILLLDSKRKQYEIFLGAGVLM